jgi:hypothetical protein
MGHANVMPGSRGLTQSRAPGAHSGQLVFTGPTTAAINAVFVITGGTGRFSGANGGGVATGNFELTTQEVSDFVMRGTISRPNH